MEELLDKTLNRLKAGQNTEEAVLLAPKEQQEELKMLLDTSLLLAKIPKLQAPKPALRRKYILEPVKQKFFSSIFHISRLAAGSTAFVLLLAVFSLGGYKALQSTPGQTLFPVKRTAESFRLKFVMSESSKAQLQLAYAESRFNEAQAILSNPQSNKEQEIAALEELSKQTQTATQSIQQVAHNQPLDSSNHPLVNKLESLAKQQAELIAKTQAENQDTDVKLAASNAAGASQSATNQAGQIKKYLTIAGSSSDPLYLVDLSADPNSISISGVIQKLNKTSITVEKLTFEISESTEIKDLDGKILTTSALKADLKIKITAKKEQNKFLAQTILLLRELIETDLGKVNGASTTPQSTTTPEQTGTTTTSILKTLPDQGPTEPENPRLGNFIIETPNPQYKP